MKQAFPKPFFVDKICIIGIGLIGGCLARALKKQQAVGSIIAVDYPEVLKLALNLGVVDEVTSDISLAVADADIVVMCTPITLMGELAQQIIPHLSQKAILTDVGSTKGSVVSAIESRLGYLPPRFVPAHPIAGIEKHGVENAFAELFQGRRVVITPHVENNYEAVTTIAAMWKATGAMVEEMGIQHHDQVLAATSHLPHLLAFATVDTLANLDDRAEIFRFAAGGFRDFTRISTSDPRMWTDICLQNQVALLKVLQQYQNKLAVLSEALTSQNDEIIFEIFRRAKHARDNFYHEPQ